MSHRLQLIGINSASDGLQVSQGRFYAWPFWASRKPPENIYHSGWLDLYHLGGKELSTSPKTKWSRERMEISLSSTDSSSTFFSDLIVILEYSVIFVYLFSFTPTFSSFVYLLFIIFVTRPKLPFFLIAIYIRRQRLKCYFCFVLFFVIIINM